MRYLPLAFALFLSFHLLHGQAARKYLVTMPLSADLSVSQEVRPVPFNDPEQPFFAWFLDWDGGKISADIRFKQTNGDWTDWQQLERDEHRPEHFVSKLYYDEQVYDLYEIRYHNLTQENGELRLHFYQPGETLPVSEMTRSYDNARDPLACPCPQPEFLDRSQWCPNNDCPPHPSPDFTEVTHMIVHHSAGVNESENWPAIVQSVYFYHTDPAPYGNGWSDIGYNWLIDPNGNVYEGRGDGVIGAHHCGANTATMGVCVLGNFTNVEPTSEALDALERLLAWEACDSGIAPLGASHHPPSGESLDHISGHRDHCATACPGDSFYPLLPDVRQQVANRIVEGCSGLPGPINLSGSMISQTNYFLLWNHNSADETGFHLERSTDGGDNYEIRAELPANTLSFNEADLEVDQLYHYRIRAVNEVDTSDYSNVLVISTFPVSTEDVRLPEASVRLVPNPVKDLLQLTFSLPENGPVALQLTDINQRLLHQQRVDPSASLDIPMSDFPAGVYLLHLTQGGRSGVWRVVKE